MSYSYFYQFATGKFNGYEITDITVIGKTVGFHLVGYNKEPVFVPLHDKKDVYIDQATRDRLIGSKILFCKQEGNQLDVTCYKNGEETQYSLLLEGDDDKHLRSKAVANRRMEYPEKYI